MPRLPISSSILRPLATPNASETSRVSGAIPPEPSQCAPRQRPPSSRPREHSQAFGEVLRTPVAVEVDQIDSDVVDIVAWAEAMRAAEAGETILPGADAINATSDDPELQRLVFSVAESAHGSRTEMSRPVSPQSSRRLATTGWRSTSKKKGTTVKGWPPGPTSNSVSTPSGGPCTDSSVLPSVPAQRT
ncbi:hypothetical protein [Collimonas fungivorans]|uniref:hypothetical protein n=1 Tax=Collimonas fungivorans TaxID=158899 RepID=UPI003FA3D23D